MTDTPDHGYTVLDRVTQDERDAIQKVLAMLDSNEE